jgi:hypothetical protein
MIYRTLAAGVETVVHVGPPPQPDSGNIQTLQRGCPRPVGRSLARQLRPAGRLVHGPAPVARSAGALVCRPVPRAVHPPPDPGRLAARTKGFLTCASPHRLEQRGHAGVGVKDKVGSGDVGRLRAGLNQKTVTKALKPWKNCLETRQSGRRKCHDEQPLEFNPPASSTEWGSGAPTDDGKPNRLGTNAPVKPCRSFGGIDLRAHAEIVSVRRSDTPPSAVASRRRGARLGRA